MIAKFTKDDLKKLWVPKVNSSGEENGQVTIIGGSSLFHGAPILAIKAASRVTDMVFFSSPEKQLEQISAKAALSSFIWVPWDEIEEYIKKSDAVLIGPGMMRYHKENSKSEILNSNKEIFDEKGTETRSVTKYLLQKYPDKQWVIDGGSLQVMEPEWIPKGAILTPNKKEYEILFSTKFEILRAKEIAKKHSCIICYKGQVSYVTDGETTYEVEGGNAGLTKGGTGDSLAGLTVALAAKNPPILAAAAASWVVKKTAEKLFEKVNYRFNADDLAGKIWEEF